MGNFLVMLKGILWIIIYIIRIVPACVLGLCSIKCLDIICVNIQYVNTDQMFLLKFMMFIGVYLIIRTYYLDNVLDKFDKNIHIE